MKSISYIKKVFSILVLAVFFVPASSFAGALYHSDSTTFDIKDLGGSSLGTTTMSWKIYNPGGTTVTDFGNVTAGASDYVYVYTMNGFTASNTSYGTLTNMTAVLDTTVSFTGYGFLNGTAPTSTTPPGAGSSAYLNAAFSGLASGSSSSFYWTSAATPGLTNATTQLTSAGSLTGTGVGLTANFVTPGGAGGSPVPGVPEPETWALLIMLSGFTMWWMRRRQDEDVVEENFTA